MSSDDEYIRTVMGHLNKIRELLATRPNNTKLETTAKSLAKNIIDATAALKGYLQANPSPYINFFGTRTKLAAPDLELPSFNEFHQKAARNTRFYEQTSTRIRSYYTGLGTEITSTSQWRPN